MSGWALLARHEHHHDMPEGEYVSGEPLGVIMYLHILVMATAFGIVYPLGMVFGLAKSKWHVPTQITASCLAITGYFLGHAHKGRQYSADNIHSKFASWVMLTAIAQVSIGVVLKLHLEKGILGRVRPILTKIHVVIAILMPIFSWVQMGFGAITIPGFCHADHLGQCLAHGIMGSSFIGYGLFLLIMLYVGEGLLARQERSQEFYDSTIITLWGIVNTFTEHRWGQPWSHHDYQHTSMGIIWWAAGMVGIFLSRNGRRNHMPAIVMIFTGYAMSQHGQNLEVSMKVHSFFGLALIAAGAVRIIEISFVLRDRPHSGYIWSWQYLTPLLLVESGMLFMGANEEQMQLLDAVGVMHSSYILVITSIALLIFLLFLFLISVYVRLSPAHATSYGGSPIPQYSGLGRAPPTSASSHHHHFGEGDEVEDGYGQWELESRPSMSAYRANDSLGGGADSGPRPSPEGHISNQPITGGDNGVTESEPFLPESRP